MEWAQRGGVWDGGQGSQGNGANAARRRLAIEGWVHPGSSPAPGGNEGVAGQKMCQRAPRLAPKLTDTQNSGRLSQFAGGPLLVEITAAICQALPAAQVCAGPEASTAEPLPHPYALEVQVQTLITLADVILIVIPQAILTPPLAL